MIEEASIPLRDIHRSGQAMRTRFEAKRDMIEYRLGAELENLVMTTFLADKEKRLVDHVVKGPASVTKESIEQILRGDFQ
ncbi:MAG: hypothetical protein M5R36_05525 [Deltaproteobacteria bacterium]|nr:hypothetical protein [Deltaproteobacteria bacterium]